MSLAKSPAANDGRPALNSGRARAVRLAALLTGVILLLLPFLFKLDGKPHADWQQFLGRFHPLAVHLPIGLIVLVPLLEIGGKFRPALREAAGFVLALAFAACLGSLTLGYLLAYGGGTAGEIATKHMWGGIALTIGAMLCLFARPGWSSGTLPRVYPALLVCVLAAMVWTADEGASLTHGSNYLTQYMPAPMKRIVSFGNAQSSAPDSFYTKRIAPIFDSNCVSCHGAGMTHGGLRLDSYELLMRGGKDGVVIVAGNPEKSVLLDRVTLPAGDKHAMPAEGKPPLRPQEIAWIRAWIHEGASPTATTIAGVSLPEEPKEPPLQPVGDYSTLMGDILQMQKGLGAKLEPVSKTPSDGLILRTADVPASFGDAQLAQFLKFAPYIVEAELGRTAVTDASFDTLSKFTHLRALHLEGTAITGSGLAKLAPLSQLTYLNLSETKVTAASVAPLASMKNLRHVYLFDTPAQPAPAADATRAVAKTTQ